MPLVAFVGRVHPQKRAEVLIDAAARLTREGTPLHVVIAGPGDARYLATLRQRASEAGIGDTVHLPGLVRGAAKQAIYSAADVFALSSEQESFGLVIIEAMACGTAAVCTRGIDLWRELEGSGGAIVTTSDAGAFADAIRTLLTDDARRTAKASAGRTWVHTTLDPERVATRFEAMYGSAIGARAKDAITAA